jgi:hypothetical protein
MTLFTADNYTSMTGNAVNVGGGVYQIADSDGTNLTFDNLLNPTTAPYVVTNNGLLFAVGPPNLHGNYYDSFGIWLNSPNVLHDWLGAGGPALYPNGTQLWGDTGPGTLTIAPVPLPAAAVLFPTGLSLLAIAFRKLRKHNA